MRAVIGADLEMQTGARDGKVLPATTEGAFCVLVLDADALVREAVAGSLRLHDGSCRPRAVANLAEALAAIADERPALVVVDPETPDGGAPAATLTRLRAAAPGVPILGLTATPRRLLEVVPPLEGIIEKPPELDYLLRRVDDLLAAHTGGVLRDVSLSSVLQVLGADRKSCAVAVATPAVRGRVWLARGRPVHAAVGELAGKEALFRLLALDSPVLRVAPAAAPGHSLDDTLPALLLEFSVLVDQGRRRS